MRSLHIRILGAFILVILISSLFHTALEYYTSYREIPRLLTQIRTDDIAGMLEDYYRKSGGWDGLGKELENRGEWGASGSGGNPAIRIVVKDAEGLTLYNSFSLLASWDEEPLVRGSRRILYGGEPSRVVGSVSAYIGRGDLLRETMDFLKGSLRRRILLGIVVLGFIGYLARVFSRRLARPVTALTERMEDLSSGRGTESLPVSSRDELGRMSRAFNEMAEALQEQKGLRKRLIGDISHDLGTPLNSIRLDARGILDRLTTPEEGARRIIAEVDRLKNLTVDLDWLAETDAGAFRLNKRDTDPGQLVEDEINRWRLKGEIEHIALKWDNRLPPRFRCDLDPDRIGQALSNLLDNGIKYSPPGGTITVSAYTEETRLFLAVRDEGEGIEKKEQSRIFERFYRTDSSRSQEGRGLGLAIVRQITELHGGSVSVRSTPGEGSRFLLSFPY